MPTTMTLKNIPDEVYERLRVAAEMHRRSLNSEAIVCLETVLTPTKIAPSERLARARQLRAGLSTKFRARDIDTLKKQGLKWTPSTGPRESKNKLISRAFSFQLRWHL